MAANKTTETAHSVTEFINAIADETKRNDCFQLIEVMQTLTRLPPKMWGTAIVGFGSYHYKYESGREGDMLLIGFSPRSTGLVLYLSQNADERTQFLQKLGKHKTGKGCIYIKKLTDVDLTVLEAMIAASLKHIESR